MPFREFRKVENKHMFPQFKNEPYYLIFPSIVGDGLVKSDLTKDYDKRSPSKEVKRLVLMKFYAITFVEIKDS